MSSKKHYFPALTGIRALAAYLVFFYHFVPISKGHWPKAWQLLHEGHIGVTIFFVLSGFLICLRYINNLDFSARWLGTYIRNRIARIYPMYFLLTCITFLFIAVDPSFDMSTQWPWYVNFDKALVIILNLTFLRGFFQRFIFTGIMQGWTLTVEECFYLIAPLLLISIRHRKRPVKILIYYGLLFLILGTGCVYILPHKYGLFNSYQFMLGFTFFGRCIEFLIGIGLGLIVSRISPKNISKFPVRTYIGVLCMLICMIGLALLDEPLDSVLGTTTNPLGILLNNLLLPIGIACFFWGLIYEQSWIRKLLEMPLFELLGKSSYVFYLIHMGIFHQLIERYITNLPFIIFGLLILLSIALFKFVEEPLHRLIAGRRKTIEHITAVAQSPPSIETKE